MNRFYLLYLFIAIHLHFRTCDAYSFTYNLATFMPPEYLTTAYVDSCVSVSDGQYTTCHNVANVGDKVTGTTSPTCMWWDQLRPNDEDYFPRRSYTECIPNICAYAQKKVKNSYSFLTEKGACENINGCYWDYVGLKCWSSIGVLNALVELRGDDSIRQKIGLKVTDCTAEGIGYNRYTCALESYGQCFWNDATLTCEANPGALKYNMIEYRGGSGTTDRWIHYGRSVYTCDRNQNTGNCYSQDLGIEVYSQFLYDYEPAPYVYRNIYRYVKPDDLTADFVNTCASVTSGGYSECQSKNGQNGDAGVPNNWRSAGCVLWSRLWQDNPQNQPNRPYTNCIPNICSLVQIRVLEQYSTLSNADACDLVPGCVSDSAGACWPTMNILHALVERKNNDAIRQTLQLKTTDCGAVGIGDNQFNCALQSYGQCMWWGGACVANTLASVYDIDKYVETINPPNHDRWYQIGWEVYGCKYESRTDSCFIEDLGLAVEGRFLYSSYPAALKNQNLFNWVRPTQIDDNHHYLCGDNNVDEDSCNTYSSAKCSWLGTTWPQEALNANTKLCVPSVCRVAQERYINSGRANAEDACNNINGCYYDSATSICMQEDNIIHALTVARESFSNVDDYIHVKRTCSASTSEYECAYGSAGQCGWDIANSVCVENTMAGIYNSDKCLRSSGNTKYYRYGQEVFTCSLDYSLGGCWMEQIGACVETKFLYDQNPGILDPTIPTLRIEDLYPVDVHATFKSYINECKGKTTDNGNWGACMSSTVDGDYTSECVYYDKFGIGWKSETSYCLPNICASAQRQVLEQYYYKHIGTTDDDIKKAACQAVKGCWSDDTNCYPVGATVLSAIESTKNSEVIGAAQASWDTCPTTDKYSECNQATGGFCGIDANLNCVKNTGIKKYGFTNCGGNADGDKYIYTYNGDLNNEIRYTVRADYNDQWLWIQQLGLCVNTALANNMMSTHTPTSSTQYTPAFENYELYIPSYVESGDQFGSVMSISDSHLLVGTQVPDTKAGYVVHYILDGERWVYAEKIVSPTPTAGDQFGRIISVYIETFAIGDPLNKKVYYGNFTVNTFKTITKDSPGFGSSVSANSGHIFVLDTENNIYHIDTTSDNIKTFTGMGGLKVSSEVGADKNNRVIVDTGSGVVQYTFNTNTFVLSYEKSYYYDAPVSDFVYQGSRSLVANGKYDVEVRYDGYKYNLTAPSWATSDFGKTADLHGNYILVGDPTAKKAELYYRANERDWFEPQGDKGTSNSTVASYGQVVRLNNYRWVISAPQENKIFYSSFNAATVTNVPTASPTTTYSSSMFTDVEGTLTTGAPFENVGYKVAIQGNYAAVTNEQTGMNTPTARVRIYEKNSDGSWVPLTTITSTDSLFGSSLTLTDSVLMIGSPGANKTFVYNIQSIYTPPSSFEVVGSPQVHDATATYMVLGTPDNVGIFYLNAGNWSSLQNITGMSISKVMFSGDYLYTMENGFVKRYSLVTVPVVEWVLDQSFSTLAGNDFDISGTTLVIGDKTVVFDPVTDVATAGRCHVYDTATGAYSTINGPADRNSLFGTTVSVDSSHVVISDPALSVIHVWSLNPVSYLKKFNGTVAAISDNSIIVGTPSYGTTNELQTGKVEYHTYIPPTVAPTRAPIGGFSTNYNNLKSSLTQQEVDACQTTPWGTGCQNDLPNLCTAVTDCVNTPQCTDTCETKLWALYGVSLTSGVTIDIGIDCTTFDEATCLDSAYEGICQYNQNTPACEFNDYCGFYWENSGGCSNDASCDCSGGSCGPTSVCITTSSLLLSAAPTSNPTKSPTHRPTTRAPTTKTPTKAPTDSPTKTPTNSPTQSPTKYPTLSVFGGDAQTFIELSEGTCAGLTNDPSGCQAKPECALYAYPGTVYCAANLCVTYNNNNVTCTNNKGCYWDNDYKCKSKTELYEDYAFYDNSFSDTTYGHPYMCDQYDNENACRSTQGTCMYNSNTGMCQRDACSKWSGSRTQCNSEEGCGWDEQDNLRRCQNVTAGERTKTNVVGGFTQQNLDKCIINGGSTYSQCYNNQEDCQLIYIGSNKRCVPNFCAELTKAPCLTTNGCVWNENRMMCEGTAVLYQTKAIEEYLEKTNSLVVTNKNAPFKDQTIDVLDCHIQSAESCLQTESVVDVCKAVSVENANSGEYEVKCTYDDCLQYNSEEACINAEECRTYDSNNNCVTLERICHWGSDGFCRNDYRHATFSYDFVQAAGITQDVLTSLFLGAVMLV